MTGADDLELRRTERLLLRRITIEDTAAVGVIAMDPRTNAHRPGGTPTVAQNAASVATFARCWDDNGIGYWVAERDGEVIGVGGIAPFDLRRRPCWNIYYRFGPQAWGHGFAAELVREAVAVGRLVDPARPALARTSAANTAAVRVAESAGLLRRPDLDHDDYVVLATGWDAPG